MVEQSERTQRRYILFGDGTVSKIWGIPLESEGEDGIREITLELLPRPSQIRKFRLSYPESYDNLQHQTIKRVFPIIDELPLGNAMIDKKLLKLAGYINKFDYILKPLQGDKDFKEFKELVVEMSKQYKYLKGVKKITDDPLSEFQYFCFSDLNNNPTRASHIFADFTNTIKNYEKRINTLEGANAQALDDVKQSRTEILERLKQNKSESDVLGEKRNYDIPPSNEDLAGRDQSYG